MNIHQSDVLTMYRTIASLWRGRQRLFAQRDECSGRYGLTIEEEETLILFDIGQVIDRNRDPRGSVVTEELRALVGDTSVLNRCVDLYTGAMKDKRFLLDTVRPPPRRYFLELAQLRSGDDSLLDCIHLNLIRMPVVIFSDNSSSGQPDMSRLSLIVEHVHDVECCVRSYTDIDVGGNTHRIVPADFDAPFGGLLYCLMSASQSLATIASVAKWDTVFVPTNLLWGLGRPSEVNNSQVKSGGGK